ncbi:MAG: hypothetical protein H6502_02995 [Candidatus Woesearchaeota archaeon]|nr:MAG: hypothetical protein H6502_02995 [Candidatus Woesearchaeota archaeon]
MNKLVITLLALLVVLGVSLFLSHPVREEAFIREEINKANYCSVDTDCVDVGGKCPFGCYVYVNEAEVERISELITAFDESCVYGCVFCPSVVCENNACKPVCE